MGSQLANSQTNLLPPKPRNRIVGGILCVCGCSSRKEGHKRVGLKVKVYKVYEGDVSVVVDVFQYIVEDISCVIILLCPLR